MNIFNELLNSWMPSLPDYDPPVWIPSTVSQRRSEVNAWLDAVWSTIVGVEQ